MTQLLLAGAAGLFVGALVAWLLRQSRVHALERELSKHEAFGEAADR